MDAQPLEPVRLVFRRVGGLEVLAMAGDAFWGVFRRVGGLEGKAQRLPSLPAVFRRVGGLEA